MAFKAGAIYGEATLDTKKWKAGLKGMTKMVGKSMLVIGALFVAGMAKSIKAADEFQKSMSNVATIIDETEISTLELTKSLYKLDPQLGDTTELTNALYQSFSSGADTAEEAMQTTVDSAKFAKAALTDTSTAVDVLTSAVNAYGDDVVSTTHASDVFFTGIKEGKMTGDQLAGSIGQSIPLFASMGISLEELTAGMAAMTKQGVQVNTTTAQLNGIINSFLKPSNEMKKALKDIGVESGSAFLEAEGLTGALKFLEEATKGDADEMSKLIPNIRGLKGAMALTGVGGKEFANILGEMETATGATQVAFDKQEKTFETLKNSFNKGMIVVGNIGKTFVDEVAVGVTQASESMIDFLISSQGAELVSTIIAKVAAGFEALKVILEPLVETVLKEMSEIWTTLTTKLDEIFGTTEKGSGAFTAFAVAGQMVNSVFNILSTIIQAGITNIGNLIKAISESGKIIGSFFDFITMKNNTTWEDVEHQIAAKDKAWEDFFVGWGTGMVDIVTTVVDEVASFGDEVNKQSNDIEIAYSTSFKKVKENTMDTYDSLITGQDAYIDYLKRSAGEIKEIFEESGEDLEEGTKGTTDNLEMTWQDYFDTIMSMASHFTSGLFNIFNQYYTNQTAKLDNETQAQMEALDQQYENGLITEEEYIEKKEAIEEQARIKANEIAKQQFETEKVNKIASVWMDAANSIAGWWAAAPQLGPVAGPIFAGVMTAATLGMAGYQTSQIATQEFVPAMAGGGMASGFTRINERGGEIVSLPDNSQVIPHDLSKKIINNNDTRQGNTINVSFKGATISDNVSLNKIVDKVMKDLGKQMRLAS